MTLNHTAQLPPVDKTHPAYSAAHELLCCLNPTVYVSLDAIAQTLGGNAASVLSKINELRRRGYDISTKPVEHGIHGGLAARVRRHCWPKAHDAAQRYWRQVYDGWGGVPRGVGNRADTTQSSDHGIYDYATTRADQ